MKHVKNWRYQTENVYFSVHNSISWIFYSFTTHSNKHSRCATVKQSKKVTGSYSESQNRAFQREVHYPFLSGRVRERIHQKTLKNLELCYIWYIISISSLEKNLSSSLGLGFLSTVDSYSYYRKTGQDIAFWPWRQDIDLLGGAGANGRQVGHDYLIT